QGAERAAGDGAGASGEERAGDQGTDRQGHVAELGADRSIPAVPCASRDRRCADRHGPAGVDFCLTRSTVHRADTDMASVLQSPHCKGAFIVTNGIDHRRRWLALFILCLGDLMIVLDTTIVNVALPSIRTALGFSETSLVWVVNAYLLTFGGFLLLGGRLGDLFGHRRLFLLGIALFTL